MAGRAVPASAPSVDQIRPALVPGSVGLDGPRCDTLVWSGLVTPRIPFTVTFS